MGIFFKDKEITAIYFGKKAISAVYRGTRLVWQAIRSCFGAGYWVDDKPWIDDEAWKD
jgi:hypothetical protein